MKIILIAVLNLFINQIAFSQNTMMVIHKKFGLKDSILVSEVTKVTFHPVSGYGLVSDVEGNTYRTVIIGNQEWMVENLRTTKYNDGTPIPLIIDRTEWVNDTLGARCINTDNLFLVPRYGFFYNAFAINTGKLAPVGWRVTTLSDWKELENAFGTDEQLVYAIRDTGNADWINKVQNATNESGLTILPAGDRIYGDYSGQGGFARFWTTSPYGWIVENVLFGNYTFYIGSSDAYKYGAPFYSGCSIRCVRDISQ